MEKSFLILSPHSDDVPLSLGSALLAGLFGHQIHVVVIFSKSAYTRFEPGTASVDITTDLRKAEERKAAQKAGYTVTFCDFPDSSVRPGFQSLNDTFDQSRQVEKEHGWTVIQETILNIMKIHRGPILGPLGCGGHIDHRIVAQCYKEFIHASPNAIPFFYEDLPYAATISTQQIQNLVPPVWMNIPFSALSLHGSHLNDKLELLSIYQSQLEERDLNCVEIHWNHQNYSEIIWVPEIFDMNYICAQ